MGVAYRAASCSSIAIAASIGGSARISSRKRVALSAVVGSGEHGAYGGADRFGAALAGGDRARHPERFAPFRAVRLVAGDRADHHRHGVGEGLLDAVEAAVGDEQRAVRKESHLRQRALNADVRGQWPQARGVLVEAEGDEQVDRLVAQRGHDRLV